ncbi:unnamed protein product, partial [Leptidea sinapis]
MEEQAYLVRPRSDSESSFKLGSFGSTSHTMTYTEDRLADGDGERGPAPNLPVPPPENVEVNDSGELLDYNDSSVLEQFHEDALRQAGCGLSQGKVILAVGLAVIGSALELSAITFVLPSAEIELCVLPHEKNWVAYHQSKRDISNVTFADEHYNVTLENTDYTRVTFRNVTFRDMLLSHVSFINCSF